MPRRLRRTFVIIPPIRTTKWECTIAGTDVKDFIMSGTKFPHGLIAEELMCEVHLDNSGEDFTDKFKARDTIIFNMNFTDGTTRQFEGEVEEVNRKEQSDGLFKLLIKGAHFTAQTMDVLVTAEFINAKIKDIRTTIIADNLTGFTTTNVETNDTRIDITFVDLPLRDCLIVLDIEGDEDTYIDFDKDFHTFKKGSKENFNNHFSNKDSLLELRGLGTDSAEVRNVITAYGEAGDLPVIATAKDSASETTYRTKPKIITDNTLTDEDQATSLVNAERTLLKDPSQQGSCVSLFWDNINPGDKSHVISKPHKIHELFRIVKHVFRLPEEDMEVFFNEERSIPKIIKDRIKKDIGQEKIINPHKMEQSYNFTFDNENKIDSAASSNIVVENSFVRRTTGSSTGNMVSNKKDTIADVTQVHVLAKGDSLEGATYFVRANLASDFKEVTLDALTNIDSQDQGKKLCLKIVITSANTRIDSAVILYK